MEGCAYKFIVAENLEVDACKCGTGMDFWPSEGLMGLSEPDQVIHGGYFEDLPVLMLDVPRPGVVVHVIRDDGGVLRVEIFFYRAPKYTPRAPGSCASHYIYLDNLKKSKNTKQTFLQVENLR